MTVKEYKQRKNCGGGDKEHLLLEGFQTTPTRPSDEECVKKTLG
jgi:hypothetical protein